MNKKANHVSKIGTRRENLRASLELTYFFHSIQIKHKMYHLENKMRTV